MATTFAGAPESLQGEIIRSILLAISDTTPSPAGERVAMSGQIMALVTAFGKSFGNYSRCCGKWPITPIHT
jgi:hypothetical protein